MARRFAMVSTSLAGSRKFKALQSDGHRLAYTLILISRHANSLGFFQLPAPFLAFDLGWPDINQAEDALADMERVGLIERYEDDYVRIVNSLLSGNAPNNPATVTSYCRALKDIRAYPVSLARAHIVLDLIEASETAAQNWNPTTGQFDQAMRDIRALGQSEVRINIKGLQSAINQRESRGETVPETVLALCGDKEREKEREKDIDKEKEIERDIERETGEIGGPRLPASPNGGRRGKGSANSPAAGSLLARQARGEA